MRQTTTYMGPTSNDMGPKTNGMGPKTKENRNNFKSKNI